MHADAIKAIQQSVAIEQANKSLPPAAANGAIALPADFKLTSLEHLMPHRQHFRGAFSTTDVDEFTSYVKDHTQHGMTCFIDAQDMNATTIFDMVNEDGDALHNDHRAWIGLKRTPEFQDLFNTDGNSLSQQAMAEYLEDNIDHVTFLTKDDENGERETIPRARAINTIRNVTIQANKMAESSVGDFDAEVSVLERTSASGKSGELPSVVRFTLKPYDTDAIGEYTFDCRLSITTGDAVKMKLSIRSLDRTLNVIARNFADAIRERLDDAEMHLYLGKFSSTIQP